MDKLERVFGHLGNFTEDELRARVRQTRADRRMAKARPGAVKKAKRSADITRVKSKKLVEKADLTALQKIMRDMGYDC